METETVWRVEVRYDLVDTDGFAHTFTGFVNVATVDEAAICAALRERYVGLRKDGVTFTLTYVEARRRAVASGAHAETEARAGK